MVLQQQGTPQNPRPISFGQIKNEFGASTNNSFGSYRVSHTIGGLSNLPLDSGIPQTGSISFSDFYGKKLNIVIHCQGGRVDYGTNVAKYGDAVVVGSLRTKPAKSKSGWQGGKKVIIHINGEYSSYGAITKGSQSERSWAFQTGVAGDGQYWPEDTSMTIDASEDAQVVGRGGNGGDRSGESGGNGSNGLRYWSGAEFGNINTTKYEQTNGAYISAGGGGGGGGSDAEQNDWGDRNDAEGGGGGGGNGIPAGEGGSGNGQAGDGGVKNGGGGKDGEDDAEAEGGDGGGGGSNGADGGGASGGKNKTERNGGGGEGGISFESYG